MPLWLLPRLYFDISQVQFSGIFWFLKRSPWTEMWSWSLAICWRPEFHTNIVYPDYACQNESMVLQRHCLLRNSVRVMKDLYFLMVYLDDISFLLFTSLSNVLLLSILARQRYVSSQVETSSSLSQRRLLFYPSEISVQIKKDSSTKMI